MLNLIPRQSLNLDSWLSSGVFETSWAPAVDILDSKDSFVVKADLPGLEKDKIQVQVEDGVLVISGEKNDDAQTQDKESIRIERYYGAFRREILLPEAINEKGIKAKYDNGVLTVTLQKVEKPQPHKVAVE